MDTSSPPKRLRILAATDLSAPADEAIRQAHAWAVASNGELIVCHVIPSPPRTNLLFPHDNERDALAIVELERLAGEYLERHTSKVTGRKAEEFEIVIDSGAPEAIIVGEAEESKADVVVIASRGATGMARLPLGTVAERVLRFAHCSVLLARPYQATGQVVAATDLSDPSLPAVRAGLAAARQRQAKLTIVHNVDTLPVLVPPLEGTLSSAGMAPLPTSPSATFPASDTVERARQHLCDVMKEHGIEGECIVTEGEPAQSIVQIAEERRAELLVVGTHGRTGFMRIALGSTAERVVQTTTCSVLVVRLAGAAPY